MFLRRRRRGLPGPLVVVLSVLIVLSVLTLLASLVVRAGVTLLMPPAAEASERWAAPVAGPPARVFAYGSDPFAAGQHRGVDLAVRPGAAVRSACSGRVAFAGAAGTSGRVVSVVCGRWRVTYLPVLAPAVRAGEIVRTGARLGRVGRSVREHGLHVGVRRSGDRLGYVDPMPFFAGRPPVPLAPPIMQRRPVRPRAPAPRLGPSPPTATATATATPLATATPPSPAAAERPVNAPRLAPMPAAPQAARMDLLAPNDRLVPWPAWVGTAMALAGAVGRGAVRHAGRRRRERTGGPASAPVAVPAVQDAR